MRNKCQKYSGPQKNWILEIVFALCNKILNILFQSDKAQAHFQAKNKNKKLFLLKFAIC